MKAIGTHVLGNATMVVLISIYSSTIMSFIMYYEIFVQIIAIVALLGFVLSFQFKKRRHILLSQAISFLVWGIHFFLLQAWTAVVIDVINSAKSFLFINKDKYHWIDDKKILYIFIIIFWGFGILSWHDWYSILPLIAVTSITMAAWQKDPKRIRLLFIPSPILWFIYDFFVGSYGSMIAEAAIFVSIIVGIWRFDTGIKTKPRKTKRKS